MPCIDLTGGYAALEDPVLGTLELGCDSGYVLTQLQIGWPTERAVMRNRALADGAFDDTRYVGPRAVTTSIRLDNAQHTTQALIDAISPYMSARRRPTLSWSLPGSPEQVRALTVRGVDMPLPIAGRYPTLVASWVSSESYVRSAEAHCHTIVPSSMSDPGRVYDLVFDRVYPAAGPSGSFDVVNAGNAPTDWVGTIFAEAVDPFVEVNGIDITFDGLTLAPSQTLVIDTEARTILLNGDPAESRYNFANYTDWTWDDLRLTGGTNTFRLDGTTPSASFGLTVCLHDRWYL